MAARAQRPDSVPFGCNVDLNGRRTPHGLALQDPDVGPGEAFPVQVHRERAGRAPGRGILTDPHGRVEEAAVRVGTAPAGDDAVDVAALAARRGEHPSQGVAVGVDGVDLCRRRQGHKQVVAADGSGHRKEDRVQSNPGTWGECTPKDVLVDARCRQLDRALIQPDGEPLTGPPDTHRQRPPTELLDGARRQGGSTRDQPPPRAERVVPGTHHFIATGCEGAQPKVRTVQGGPTDEGGLGKAELDGDGSHLFHVEVVGVGDDGERVTGQWAVGEDVDDRIRVCPGELVGRRVPTGSVAHGRCPSTCRRPRLMARPV